MQKNAVRGRGRANQRGRGSFRGRGGWQQRDNSNFARYVAKQGTMQTSAIKTSLMIEEMEGINKGTMPHHQTMIMMGAYL